MTLPSSTDPARPTPVWAYPLVTLFVWAVVIGLVLYFFDAFKIVLMGFLAAAVVASLLKPLLSWMPGSRPTRGAILGILSILSIAGVLALLTWALASPVKEAISSIPELRQTLDDALANLSRQVPMIPTLDTATLLQGITEQFGWSSMVSWASAVISGAVLALVFILFGPLYLLAERPGTLSRPVQSFLPARRHIPFARALTELEPRLRWYALGQLMSMTIVGALSYAGYSIVGLRFALALAFIAALAELVPTFGPITAALVALAVASTQGMWQIGGVLIVYAIIQTLESYVILPLVMKRAAHIPPIVTLFTVIFWGKVLGPAGLVLALPIDLVIYTFADNFLRRRPENPAPPTPASPPPQP